MTPILKKMNPIRLILVWLAITVTATLIYVVVLGLSTSGGQQKPFIFIGKVIPVIVYGILFIGVVTIPFYSSWVKKHWYVNLFFIIGSLIFIFINLKQGNKSPYYIEKKNLVINGKIIEQIIEYYDSKFQKVRSVSFYINGGKDSIWTVFSRNGEIISQEKFSFPAE